MDINWSYFLKEYENIYNQQFQQSGSELMQIICERLNSPSLKNAVMLLAYIPFEDGGSQE